MAYLKYSKRQAHQFLNEPSVPFTFIISQYYDPTMEETYETEVRLCLCIASTKDVFCTEVRL